MLCLQCFRTSYKALENVFKHSVMHGYYVIVLANNYRMGFWSYLFCIYEMKQKVRIRTYTIKCLRLETWIPKVWRCGEFGGDSKVQKFALSSVISRGWLYYQGLGFSGSYPSCRRKIMLFSLAKTSSLLPNKHSQRAMRSFLLFRPIGILMIRK